MSMKKVADICVAGGKFTSKGEEKTRWVKVGIELQDEKGAKMRLLDRTFNPAGCPQDGRDTVVLHIFPVKENAGEAPAHKGFDKQGDVATTDKPMDDEIPF